MTAEQNKWEGENVLPAFTITTVQLKCGSSHRKMCFLLEISSYASAVMKRVKAELLVYWQVYVPALTWSRDRKDEITNTIFF